MIYEQRKKKARALAKINGDINYLREEYKGNELWGKIDAPVEFEDLLAWVRENEYEVKMMIDAAKALVDL